MDRLQLLSETMRSFAEATADPRTLLDTIARRTGEAMRAYCGFAVISEDEQWLNLVAIYDADPRVAGVIQKLASGAPLRLDSPHPLARTLLSGRPTLLPAVTDELLRARFPEQAAQDEAIALRIKSVLFVPLIARGKWVGAFSVVRHGENETPFEEEDVSWAQNIADHAALAIANAKLVTDAQRELTERKRLEERLRLLSGLAQEFSGEISDHQRLLDRVTKRVGELIGEMCAIRLVSEDGERLETTGSVHHPDPELEGAVRAAMLARPQKLGEGLAGKVAASGQPLLIPELPPGVLAAGVQEHQRAIVEKLAFNSLLAVPLLSRGKALGVLTLARSKKFPPYREDDQRLLEDVARHASLAIANARMFAERERVTARRLEQEERTRRVQEASRLKNEFMANMSHELRTPLNAIIGFAALMHTGKTGPIADVHKEYVGDILSSARHLLQLINDVLDLSKIEAGRMEIKVEEVELASLVNEVKDIVRALADEKRIALEVRLDGALARVRTDPRMLKQILYNFLSNAIKFTPEGGRVAVSVLPESDDMFRVDVEDNGIGIRAEEMSRLFVEFQQLDGGYNKKYPGTGLGLALTKRIAEALKGRVDVKSTFGEGSTFSATLPR